MAEHRAAVVIVAPRSPSGRGMGNKRQRRSSSTRNTPLRLLLLTYIFIFLGGQWCDTRRNPTFYPYHYVSATSPQPQQQTSIPRSTNSRHAASSSEGHHPSDASALSDPGRHHHHPPWNPSKNIDDDGFLVDLYECVPGEWEMEIGDGFDDAHDHHRGHAQHHHPVGGRYADLRKKSRFIFGVTGSHHHHRVGVPSGGNMVRSAPKDDSDDETSSPGGSGAKRSPRTPEEAHRERDVRSPHLTCRVRQVPGDGNCLFHSVSATLHHALTRRHVDMRNSTFLRASSADLRRRAVECLSRRRRRMLFLQAREYLRAGELVDAAAGQYNISAEEYCDLMGKESYWGGGPEIVALCNVLRRPIHVYELSESSPRPPPPEEEEEGGGGDDDGEDRHRRRLGNGRYHRPYHHARGVGGGGPKAGGRGKKEFRLRRMACFGSPKFDRREPLHILSADSRFPDVSPGRQLPSGNHFLALFPYSPHSPPPPSSV